MRRTIPLIAGFLVIAVVLSGCGVLQKLGIIKDDSDELFPVSSIVMGEEEAKKLTDKVPIHLYFANEDNTKLRKEIRYIPLSEAKKSTSNLASIIVKELIKGPTAGGGLKATIPAGTQLRSPVTINAGIATVDLSKEFVDKHPGGKAAEQMTIFSIVNSLTELKDIQKVKFMIEGKERSEFKGNFRFNAPFPRSPSLISSESVVPALPDNTGSGGQSGQVPESGGTGGNKPSDTSSGPSADSEDIYIELEEEILE